MKSFGLILFSFLFVANLGAAFAQTQSPETPCCEVLEIKENGVLKVKEIQTNRTFNVQIDDKAQLERVQVGQPLYVDFDTGAVGLDPLRSSSSRSSEDTHTEPFIDFYVGSTSTQKADVQGTSAFGNANANDVKFDSSLVGGMRLGAWMPSVRYLGFAVDAFYFTTNIKPQTLTGCIGTSCGALSTTAETKQEHFAIAFDIMLRLPLAKSEEFPVGRFQPYITVGPALFISRWKEPGFSSTTTTLGFKGGAGAKFFFTNNVALFGEYRLTSFEPEQSFRVANVQFDVSNRLTTHHFLGGLSIHF